MSAPAPCAETAFDLAVGGGRLRARSLLPPGTALAGAGPVLVFLHEGLGSITQWRDVPRALVQATGLPALVYDRRGYGRSASRARMVEPGYLEAEGEKYLPAVLDVCGIRRPLLVGHSDGATIALLFAARFPKRPAGVVAEAPHVFVEEIALKGIRRALRSFETTAFRDRLKIHHGANVDAMFHGWSDVWLAPAFRDWTMVDRLAKVRCPVLAIQGEDDEYGTPAQVTTIARDVSGPVTTLLLPDCGHIPHFQARERVLEAIAGFVRELGRN